MQNNLYNVRPGFFPTGNRDQKPVGSTGGSGWGDLADGLTDMVLHL